MSFARVDAILDMVDDDTSPATALADYLDKRGEWDWSDGADHEPSDRVAVVESSGAFWAVYRGTEGDEAVRCETKAQADAKADEWIDLVEGGRAT